MKKNRSLSSGCCSVRPQPAPHGLVFSLSLSLSLSRLVAQRGRSGAGAFPAREVARMRKMRREGAGMRTSSRRRGGGRAPLGARPVRGRAPRGGAPSPRATAAASSLAPSRGCRILPRPPRPLRPPSPAAVATAALPWAARPGFGPGGVSSPRRRGRGSWPAGAPSAEALTAMPPELPLVPISAFSEAPPNKHG